MADRSFAIGTLAEVSESLSRDYHMVSHDYHMSHEYHVLSHDYHMTRTVARRTGSSFLQAVGALPTVSEDHVG